MNKSAIKASGSSAADTLLISSDRSGESEKGNVMKLLVLTVFGICFAHMCFAWTNHEKNYMRPMAREYLGEVSDRFIDDAQMVFEKFDDQRFAWYVVGDTLYLDVMRILRRGNIPKVDVDSITKYRTVFLKEMFHSYNTNEWSAEYLDYLKILHSIYLERLPARIANGMINLLYVTKYENATTEDMENAVNYLYSNETVVIEDPLRDIPLPNASECPEDMGRYSTVQDKLKAMEFIKPSVLQDVAAIVEKFPCEDRFVTYFVEDFAEIVRVLHAFAESDKKPISACLIGENWSHLEVLFYHFKRGPITYSARIGRDQLGEKLKRVDLILSTRLTDEHFRGLINLEKAAILETPTFDEIQRALEYVFVDVAPLAAEC